VNAVCESEVRRAAQLHERQPGDAATLPVLPSLRTLLPAGGLVKGQVAAVGEYGTLCLVLMAAASAAGAWCAVAGIPEFGVVAAAQAGVDPDRLLLVPDPGEDWARVAATLIDACELVVLRPPEPATAPVRRRLEATLRRGRSVLLIAGDWPGAQVRLQVVTRRWTGIGDGHGRLRACRAEVRADGRGAGAVPQTRWFWLPAEDGTVTADERTEETTVLTGPAHRGFGQFAVSGDIPVEAQSFEASGPDDRGSAWPAT
jgi:hypothetical protein